MRRVALSFSFFSRGLLGDAVHHLAAPPRPPKPLATPPTSREVPFNNHPVLGPPRPARPWKLLPPG